MSRVIQKAQLESCRGLVRLQATTCKGPVFALRPRLDGKVCSPRGPVLRGKLSVGAGEAFMSETLLPELAAAIAVVFRRCSCTYSAAT